MRPLGPSRPPNGSSAVRRSLILIFFSQFSFPGKALDLVQQYMP
jgi:hypothetical protein